MRFRVLALEGRAIVQNALLTYVVGIVRKDPGLGAAIQLDVERAMDTLHRDDQTPEALLADFEAQGSRFGFSLGTWDALRSALNTERSESAILRTLNNAVRAAEPLAPWTWTAHQDKRGVQVRFKFAGERVDPDTDWTQDDRSTQIQQALTKLGAQQTLVNSATTTTPREWPNGGSTVVAYSGEFIIPFTPMQLVSLTVSDLRAVAATVVTTN